MTATVLADVKNIATRLDTMVADCGPPDIWVWQYEQAADVWHSFDISMAKSLEETYHSYVQGVQPQPVLLNSVHHQRRFDVVKMEQHNMQTGRKRRLRRVHERKVAPRLQSEQALSARAMAARKLIEMTPKLVKSLLSKVQGLEQVVKALSDERDAMQKSLLHERDAHQQEVQALHEKMHDLEVKIDNPLDKRFWQCLKCDEPNSEKRVGCNNCGASRREIEMASKTSHLLNRFREAIEMWRDPQLRGVLGPMHSIEDPSLCDKMERILRSTSHAGPGSRCDAMSKAVVTRVLYVINPGLWNEYLRHKESMRQAIDSFALEGFGGRIEEVFSPSTATVAMQGICAKNTHCAERDVL
eukprot:TRINITY_DN21809_c0_g1_i1.p1 TRINITY_DN21809_c0_g1~~TRINITY_DN21809_c0_g1_i1.p1  ORF type:complete len:379 (+),score=68.22 TRINITY_DN21809_c0_g1_i1:70-1137(+)